MSRRGLGLALFVKLAAVLLQAASGVFGANFLRATPVSNDHGASIDLISALSIARGAVFQPVNAEAGGPGLGPPPPAPVLLRGLRPLQRPTTSELATVLMEGSMWDFKDVQPTCDKLAGMAKDKNKAEESKCDSVILGGANSWGCKCNYIGESLGGCPFKEDAHNPGKEVSDLGFTRVMQESKFGDMHAGSMESLTCMYYIFPGDVFQADPERTQANLRAMKDEATAVLKGGNEAAYSASKGAMFGLKVLTAPPWPVDKYGTPMCFGLCTTLNIPYWMQWTVTPEPKEG